MSNCSKVFLVLITMLLVAANGGIPLSAQSDNQEFFRQFESGETKERVAAVRALSTKVIRHQAKETEKTEIIEFLKKSTNDMDAVVRLTVHVELLKIGAGNNDVKMVDRAMEAANDKNINVRRGILKYFRSFYSGREGFGESQRDLLLNKMDDPDLEIRYQVASTLFSWGVSNDAIVDTLIDSLEMNNYRASSVYALVSDKVERNSTVKKLSERLKSTKHNASAYINLLSLLAPESNTTFDQILKMFGSEQVAVRGAVVDAIGRMGIEKEKSLKVLAEASDDISPAVRGLVLPSLVRLEPSPAKLKDAVFKLLGDQDDTVSGNAASGFAFFDNDFGYILPEIKVILASDNEQQVSAALAGISSCGPMASGLLPDVINLLESENADLRLKACWTVLDIAENRQLAVSALTRLLDREKNATILSSALQTLSQFQPTDETSKLHFLKHLDDKNENNRFASVFGLAKSAKADDVERIIQVECRPNERFTNRLSSLDKAIVSTLVATGVEGAKILTDYVDNADPFIRGRAMRALSHSDIIDEQTRKKIVAGLNDKNEVVRLSAATAIGNFKNVEASVLEQIFEMTNANERQRTINILNLLSAMGEKAAPISTKIASLMNGTYRNRYANDAKKAIVELGRHAASAIGELAAEPLTIHKLDCIAAVGVDDAIVAKQLQEFIEMVTKRIGNERNLNIIRSDRRNRLFAATALANVSGKADLATKIIREELSGDARDIALASIQKLDSIDPQLMADLIRSLPEKGVINTLAACREKASAATEPLANFAASGNRETQLLAKRALWLIQNDPDLAIKSAKQTLHENRFDPVDIKLENRQLLWETLRFLNDNHSQNANVIQFLESVNRSRYPNLRNFVSELQGF